MGFPIAEGQLSLTLRDFARWASVMINDGCNLAGERIVAKSFIADTCAPNPASHAAFNAVEPSARFPRGHYRNQFWITEPQLGQFTMLGIHGQFAWFDLRAELMIIGYGSFPVATSPLLTLAQQGLWRRIGDALRDTRFAETSVMPDSVRRTCLEIDRSSDGGSVRRTRSSHPWALGRRHPWRLTVRRTDPAPRLQPGLPFVTHAV